MQLIAAAQGLEGVSMECANLLINGSDAYLKKLIKSCVELVGARSGHDLSKNNSYTHQFDGKHFPVSLLDFKVAMELNPQQLGEDWAFLLEKICIHVFDQLHFWSNSWSLICDWFNYWLVWMVIDAWWQLCFGTDDAVILMIT